MKREIVLTCAALSVALLSGCYSHRRTVVVRERPAVATSEVVVTTAPPSPKREVIGVAPSSSHIWIEGFWAHQGGRWVWVPGHWETRPRVGAAWVPGHWDNTSRGWVWTPGHWE